MSSILKHIRLTLLKTQMGYAYIMGIWQIYDITLLDLDATVKRLKEFESRPVYQRVGGSF